MSPASSSKPAPKAKAAISAGKPASASANGPVEMARELAAIAETHSLSELILESSGLTLTIRRGGHAGAVVHMPSPVGVVHGHAPMMPAPMAPSHHAPGPSAAAAAAPAEDSRHVVTSPFVGTFYRSPSPERDPYVREGSKVEKGQVLCIVEAMKLMNEIEADVGGVISEVLVENGKTVEYGQPLFKISPA
jgi:acetyl-CoA carboxylase biotin carboxyl carrier protein